VPLQHKLIGLYNRDEKCLQRGTDWVFKYSILPFVFKGLIIGQWYLQGEGLELVSCIATAKSDWLTKQTKYPALDTSRKESARPPAQLDSAPTRNNGRHNL